MRAIGRGLALFALGPVKLVLFVVQVIAIVAISVGLVFLFPLAAERSRWLANLARRLAGEWSGTSIPLPYQPRPAPVTRGPDGFYRSPDGRRLYPTAMMPTFLYWSRWVWRDPATWRDLAWLLVDPLIGGALAILPAALVGYGFCAVLVPGVSGVGPLGVVVGVAGIALGWWIAPRALRLHGAWTKLLLAPASAVALARGQVWRHAVGGSTQSAFRCLGLGLLSLAAAPLFAWCVVVFLLTGPLVGLRVLVWLRWLPNLVRQVGRNWCGLDLPQPYLETPADDGDASTWRARLARLTRSVGHDPATWRDLLWLGCQPIVGLPLLLPPAIVGYGGWGLWFPGVVRLFAGDSRTSSWYGALFGSTWLAAVVGIALFGGGILIAPAVLYLHGRWLPVLLGPTADARLAAERERLAERVEHLTETRTAAANAQAAEVRRIERDLHDGTQARLVAMGMTLGAVEALIDHDPAAAKRLVAQVRDTSATALAELRNLVRGIHPPVLAERGLVDAIRALALDSPLAVQVTAAMPGHAEPPLESAVYFAVAEALTNAARHSGADKVWIDVRHRDGLLRITVIDDGRGGADPSRGSGLRGIERRLGTFDGRVGVSSPPGGPTKVTMELPCVLSSPRTSTSSETA